MPRNRNKFKLGGVAASAPAPAESNYKTGQATLGDAGPSNSLPHVDDRQPSAAGEGRTRVHVRAAVGSLTVASGHSKKRSRQEGKLQAGGVAEAELDVQQPVAAVGGIAKRDRIAAAAVTGTVRLNGQDRRHQQVSTKHNPEVAAHQHFTAASAAAASSKAPRDSSASEVEEKLSSKAGSAGRQIRKADQIATANGEVIAKQQQPNQERPAQKKLRRHGVVQQQGGAGINSGPSAAKSKGSKIFPSAPAPITTVLVVPEKGKEPCYK